MALTQPSRVIYLPPGVMPAGAQPSPTPASVPGIPFDRGFFQQVLPAAVDSFCKQAPCGTPVVEVLTVDGLTHYVKGISGVADSWVALHTSRPEHTHPVEVFLPYQTIFRVEIHGDADERRGHLGFIDTTPDGEAPQVKPPAPAVPEAPTPTSKPTAARKGRDNPKS